MFKKNGEQVEGVVVEVNLCLQALVLDYRDVVQGRALVRVDATANVPLLVLDHCQDLPKLPVLADSSEQRASVALVPPPVEHFLTFGE